MMAMQTIPAPVDIRGSTVIRSMIEALASQMLPSGALHPQIDHRLQAQTVQGRGRTCCLPFAYTKKLLKAGINRAGESIRIIRVYTTQEDYLTVTGMASQEWLAIRTVGLNTAPLFT